MKKILFALLVVALLVGCASTEDGYTKPKADVAGPDVKETDLPAEKIPSRTSASTGPTFLSDDLEEMAEKSKKVTSLEYSYSEFAKGEKGYYAHVYLKGNLMRQEIELASGTYVKGTLYDTVYLDLAKGTVAAYCEKHTCEDRNRIIPKEFSDFNVETPFDALNSINKGFKKTTAMYEERESVVVEYEDAGNTVNVWIWEYRGLPLKYEVRNSNDELLKKVEFLSLVVNGVKDEQLTHQFID